jgi:hypothetical protein
MRAGLVALLLVLASSARAHNVPVLPSTCVFDPIEVTAPGATVVVAPPAGAADQLTITYDNSSASLATFDLRSVPARALTVGGAAGTLGFPALFQARMLASGDLVVPSLALSLSVGGAAEAVPVTLTTGVVAGDGLVAEGAPIGADGRFTMVALSAAGVAGVGGGRMLARLGCQALPPPDLDQFLVPPEVRTLTGAVRKGTLKLRAEIRTDQQDAPDFASFPAVLRASVADVTVGALAVSAGLARRGKSFAVESAAGGTLSVRVLRRLAPARWVVKARVPGATMPAGAGSLRMTLELGGLLARESRPFRLVAGGLRLTR